jgi:LysR family transcriptional regulator, nitrogen assimilation regulatory protein
MATANKRFRKPESRHKWLFTVESLSYVPDMNLSHIERFIGIADAGSVSQAAIQLGLNQPTLSRGLRELEESLGCALLYRNGRGVVLTEDGKKFYHQVHDAIEHIRLAANTLCQPDRPLVERATIAMPPTVGRILTRPLAQGLNAAFPSAKLCFVEAFSGHLLEWLSSGRVDVAILYELGSAHRLHAEPLVTETLSVIMSADQRLGWNDVKFADLANRPLVLPSAQHGLRKLLDNIARQVGIKLNVVAEVDSLPSLLDLVEAGLGWTILPNAAVAKEIERGQLASARLAEPEVKRNLVLATAPNRPPGRGHQDVIHIIKQQIKAALAST